MNFDEMNELERKTMLEEIRKRAEEAELERIEAEEIRLTHDIAESPIVTAHVKTVEFDQAPSIAANMTEAPPPQAVEPPLALQHQPRVVRLSTEQKPVEASFPLRKNTTIKSAAEQKAKRKQEQKRIAELLASAEESYRGEKYERALENINEILLIDPENTDALTRRTEIEKAKELSERLKEEEEKRLAAEADDNAKQQNVITKKHQTTRKELEAVTVQVESKEEISVDAAPARQHTDRKMQASVRRKSRRALVWFGFAALTVVGIAAAYVVYENFRGQIFSQETMVLVLPAKNSTAKEYLGDALTEELIKELAHIRGVHVISARTAFALRSTDAAQASALAHASFVVDWTIRERAEGYELHIRLTEAKRAALILDHAVTIARDRLSTFANEIVPLIAAEIGADAKAIEQRQKNTATKPDAYDLYAQALSLLNHRETVSLDSIASVLEMARGRDGEFPPVEIALGWTNLLRYDASGEQAKHYLEDANKNVLRAINLGARMSDVYALWGSVEYCRANFAVAVERLTQATDASTSDANAWRRLSLAYLRSGTNEQALQTAERAALFDPLNPLIRSHRGMLLALNNQNAQAVNEFEAGLNKPNNLRSDSSDLYLAALLKSNQPERALDILKERVDLNSSNFIAFYDYGRMLQLAGKPKADWEQAFHQALVLIGDTLKRAPSLALAYSYRGLIQTRLGFFDEATAANEKALSLEPTNTRILYNSARLFALQRNKVAQAITQLTAAADRQFILSEFLDLDLETIRTDPSFPAIIAHR